jgi:2-polyprenyl-6-methoxyphenol hydroxylase-like FAD-dependent oxidoreductase
MTARLTDRPPEGAPAGTRPRRRVIIVGGSLAGLLAGNQLHRSGWEVDVLERTDGVLEGRGAGITVLPGLVEGFRAAGADEAGLGAALGIDLPARIALDRTGRIVAQRTFSQVMTSWRRLYELLKAAFPAERYHSGTNVERIEQDDDRVSATLSDGRRIDADLLIGADGLRSTVRNQFLPGVKPFYPGYIAWRCLADEAELPTSIREQLFDRYAVCVAPGEQGIAYPVPGPGPEHSMQPGRRQYNVVWYTAVPEDGLPRLMTDDNGRYHPGGIPPALIRARVRQEMMDMAQKVLAPQFAEAIRRARLIFFQPIVDLESPRMVFGRVVVIGDAAFTARPHVAMGVPKAAGDVAALVEAVADGGADWMSALQVFEAKRLRMSHAIVARGQYLGTYMEAQLKPQAQRLEAEAARVAEQVMMETAAPTNYD